MKCPFISLSILVVVLTYSKAHICKLLIVLPQIIFLRNMQYLLCFDDRLFYISMLKMVFHAISLQTKLLFRLLVCQKNWLSEVINLFREWLPAFREQRPMVEESEFAFKICCFCWLGGWFHLQHSLPFIIENWAWQTLYLNIVLFILSTCMHIFLIKFSRVVLPGHML